MRVPENDGMTSTPDTGDICQLCITIKNGNSKHVVRRLMRVNGVVVCPHCDSVSEWPIVKRGEA